MLRAAGPEPGPGAGGFWVTDTNATLLDGGERPQETV